MIVIHYIFAYDSLALVGFARGLTFNLSLIYFHPVAQYRFNENGFLFPQISSMTALAKSFGKEVIDGLRR